MLVAMEMLCFAHGRASPWIHRPENKKVINRLGHLNPLYLTPRKNSHLFPLLVSPGELQPVDIRAAVLLKIKPSWWSQRTFMITKRTEAKRWTWKSFGLVSIWNWCPEVILGKQGLSEAVAYSGKLPWSTWTSWKASNCVSLLLSNTACY